MKIGKLNVVVRWKQFTTGGPQGRLYRYTHVIVRMGDEPFATGRLVGKLSQEEAIDEFKRNPNKFKAVEGITTEMVKAIAA